MSNTYRAFLTALMTVASVGSYAQSITTQPTPYQDNPALPFQSAVQAQRNRAQEWKIELADGSLSRTMRRWSRVASFPVLYEAPKDLPVVAATYTGDFLQVIEQVMRDTANSSYPLHACAFDNVVRILHISQNCTR